MAVRGRGAGGARGELRAAQPRLPCGWLLHASRPAVLGNDPLPFLPQPAQPVRCPSSGSVVAGGQRPPRLGHVLVFRPARTLEPVLPINVGPQHRGARQGEPDGPRAPPEVAQRPAGPYHPAPVPGHAGAVAGRALRLPPPAVPGHAPPDRLPAGRCLLAGGGRRPGQGHAPDGVVLAPSGPAVHPGGRRGLPRDGRRPGEPVRVGLRRRGGPAGWKGLGRPHAAGMAVAVLRRADADAGSVPGV